ncbi:MAG: nucleotidyltransferase family protein [Hyphomicrobiaceae bacterium]
MKQWRPRRAMVLAAGLGLRMRPLTTALPKPLVTVAGKALIDHTLDRLADAGIEEVVVNVHYLADMLEDHVRDRVSPRVIISDERQALLDTGGGIVKALPHLGREPFLICNSDSISSGGVSDNLDRLCRMWDPDRMDSLMLLASSANALGYEGTGDFAMCPDGLLRRRTEREVTPFVFTGFSIAHPRLFEDCPQGAFSLNLLWDRAIERGRLYGVRQDGTWMHIGSPDARAAAERFWQIGELYF